MTIQSNLSGSSLEHYPPPWQIELYFFSIYSADKHLRYSTHWSPALKDPSADPRPHLSPRFKSLPVTKLGKRNDGLCTIAAAAVTVASSDTGGRSAAVELSLLLAAFPYCVARGIKHS
jgi:hypothetical protein